jgi:hypothetical protein
MLPVTALTMLVLLFVKQPTQADIYHWYFYSWLALGSYLVARKDLTVTNKQTLWLSVVLCLLVPVLNGVVRGNWFWRTYATGQFDMLLVDLLFLTLAFVSGLVVLKMRQRAQITRLEASAGSNQAGAAPQIAPAPGNYQQA